MLGQTLRTSAFLSVVAVSAAAAPITFDIDYNLRTGNGSASAVVVIDDSIFDLPVGTGPAILNLRTDDGTFDALTSFELTISGVANPANNGVFTLSDFDVVRFSFSQELDPTQELFSQFTQTGPGTTFDFNFESSTLGIVGIDRNIFATSIGGRNPDGTPIFAESQFTLASITPRVDPIPLPAAGWLLVAGLSALGLMTRRSQA